MIRKALIIGTWAIAGLAGLSLRASAQLDFHVLMDTSNLTAGDHFGIEFTLSDGSGTFNRTNSVVVNNVSYGGSFVGLVPPNIGNASSNGTGTILSFSDGDPGGVADLEAEFTAGSAVSFDTHVTIPNPSAGSPDIFQIRLLTDPSGSNTYLSTGAPGGQNIDNAFVVAQLTNGTLAFTSVSHYNGTSPVISVTISSAAVTTPEPGAVALLGAGGAFGGLGLLRRRRARRA